jgi:molybdenum cofactor biosynthesis enzyme MoaA
MKFGTLSVVCGTAACNANCPFCVSKMTTQEEDVKDPNWSRLDVACRLAEASGVTTALLTGKGEPTLVPKLISKYVARLGEYFPLVELQTNGIELAHSGSAGAWLNEWACDGMTLICISVVHYERLINADMMQYKGRDFDLATLVKRIQDADISVRINCTVMRGGIETHEDVGDMINFCIDHGVEQLTLREVTRPYHISGFSAGDHRKWTDIIAWTQDHKLKITDPETGMFISGDKFLQDYVEQIGGQKLLHLPHGAMVYDVEGQNVCTNNCLTDNLNPDEIRQLIYFPDGHLRYDWKYKGAIII